MAKVAKKKVEVIETVAVVETPVVVETPKTGFVKAVATPVKGKANSFKNFCASILTLKFLAEAQPEQLEHADHQGFALAALQIDTPELTNALLQLQDEKLLNDEFELTALGRKTVISRNNWEVASKFKMDFYEFLRNTQFGYQFAALQILLFGDSKVQADGIITRIEKGIANKSWKASPEFNKSLFASWKAIACALDDLGMSNEMDNWFNKK
jgi:hypothetical protein